MKSSGEIQILLQARNISRTFASGRGSGFFSRRSVKALQNVSIEIARGEKVGLIGRSGSGKSTLIRCLARLIHPDEGQIYFKEHEITSMRPREFRSFRRHLQVIFQNNYSALNPGMKVREMLRETARIGGHDGGLERVIEAQMNKVNLSPALLDRYPRELSGGECRRIGVAMIDLIGPELLLADEPVTALDYINKWEMISLFDRLNREKGTALLLATHDLEAMTGFVQRVLVLYGGFLVECLPIEKLWEPRHPHTVELVRYHGFLKNMFTEGVLSSYNFENKDRVVQDCIGGCVFIHQCQRFRLLGNPGMCVEKQPALEEVDISHKAACHYHGKVVE